jgi:hypothetical protein
MKQKDAEVIGEIVGIIIFTICVVMFATFNPLAASDFFQRLREMWQG